ncbi:hypothetical protein [Mastigocoleus testarum]|uniref:Uncharacterized protein n=1 Tax=Mastigocoleus testarum BC008 TaxID=371196 RepID=A0A0V7ZR16_9CYAN|nr:hypothetical protein [Mastigocoleus testarum]KST66874.1 hypothetical protein BC008_27185 [Mastigocoleus testarum BC008]KST70212.1 hypothetical protein BC008_36790 [Mastigocoleus testarum BC008]
MSHSLNKLESLSELSSLQEEAISGGKSSLYKIPRFSYVEFPFGKLFGLEINQTSFYQREESSDRFSKSDENGNLSANDSKVEETDINRLTIG